MTLRLDGQTFAITGASRGIGREYALLLGRMGANVVVNASSDAAREVAAEVGDQAVAVAGDVSDPEVTARIVATALDRFGALHGVVANAGFNDGRYPFPDIDGAALRRMLDVHVVGTWGLVQAAWPHFRSQEYGRVVLTTSQAALFGMRRGAHYATAKGAVIGLTRALSAEAWPLDIRVNAIAPIAASVMTEATLGPDQAAHYRDIAPPSFVAPLVAVLLHRDCPVRGEIVNCGAGVVNRVFVAAGRGATFGLDDLTPEAVAAAFDRVLDERDYIVPSRMEDLREILPSQRR
jgi:NAD(P)-dependent dehydrogenase (short-subunit alcohol dehydrogenase family)